MTDVLGNLNEASKTLQDLLPLIRSFSTIGMDVVASELQIIYDTTNIHITDARGDYCEEGNKRVQYSRETISRAIKKLHESTSVETPIVAALTSVFEKLAGEMIDD